MYGGTLLIWLIQGLSKIPEGACWEPSITWVNLFNIPSKIIHSCISAGLYHLLLKIQWFLDQAYVHVSRNIRVSHSEP